MNAISPKLDTTGEPRRGIPRQLYEEVRGYAAPLKLERERWDLSGIWRQAWANLALPRQGRAACVREETGGLDLEWEVAHFRLEQVFRNILENALAACRDPVQITIGCAETVLGGRAALRVVVRAVERHATGLQVEVGGPRPRADQRGRTAGNALGVESVAVGAAGDEQQRGTPQTPGSHRCPSPSSKAKGALTEVRYLTCRVPAVAIWQHKAQEAIHSRNCLKSDLASHRMRQQTIKSAQA